MCDVSQSDVDTRIYWLQWPSFAFVFRLREVEFDSVWIVLIFAQRKLFCILSFLSPQTLLIELNSTLTVYGKNRNVLKKFIAMSSVYTFGHKTKINVKEGNISLNLEQKISFRMV